jgi:VanZ family protein
MQRSSAWPLALCFLGLVVYASLYPFADWRDQGLPPFAFLWASPSRYWTGFDVGSNLLGYFPLGFLLTLGALRSGHPRHAVVMSVLACTVVSLAMETLQSYLPMRVPSNTDLALNMAGGWVGAAMASRLEAMGAIDRWSRVRARWFQDDASGALSLLALWPVGLLFPTPVPFGLGQIAERLEASLADWLEDSPFLEWLPVREVELQPLVPLAEVVCVTLGLLIPSLVAFCVIRAPWRRLVGAVGVLFVGLGASSLSAALSYSPRHAWDWLQMPTLIGVGLAALMALLFAFASRRTCAAVGLLAVGVFLGVLNQSSADPYLAQTLQGWEQGRFIRFNGLAQWVGWLWPYLAIIYLMQRVRDG